MKGNLFSKPKSTPKVLKFTIMAAILLLPFLSTNSFGQCNNGTAYGTATLSAVLNGTASITCHYAGEYGTWSSAVSGNTYRFNSGITTDYLTVRSGSPSGAVVAFGTQPLTWVSAYTGTVYVHVNTNSSCGVLNSCRTVTATTTAVGGGGGSCTYTVPASGNNSITTCSGTICDPGGSGDYLVNQNGYTVINPTAGNLARITGVSSAGESCCDYVRVYDGSGTGGTILGTYYMGTAIPQLTSTTGPLTIQFYSDVSVVGAGFSATISCVAATLPGENCSNAQNLASLTSPYSATTVGYADDISTCWTGYGDRIFYISVPNGSTLTIGESANSYDEYEYIGYGATCPGTTTINCWDNDALAQTIWTNTTGAAQTVWYIQDGYSGTGTFTLQWSVSAAFDPCASITNISACGVSTSATIASGTGSYNPPSTTCGFTTPGQEKIYTFTPSVSGLYQIAQTASFGFTDYFFKAVSGGCSGTGWTCIGDLNGSATTISTSFNLTAGVQYYIMLDPESTTGGNVTFSIVCPPAPANDACANAINIASLPYTSAVINNATATDDVPSSTCTGPYKNVWWKVTGICGTMTAITCTGGTNFDNEMAVFTGSCGSMTQVACNDDNGAGCTSNYAGVSWQGTAGVDYYISVGSYTTPGTTGNLQLNVTAVADAPPSIGSVTAGTNPVCGAATTTLNANSVGGAGATVTWWTGMNGTGSNLGTGTSLPNAGAGTYYARVTGNCSPAAEASIIITSNTPVNYWFDSDGDTYGFGAPTAACVQPPSTVTNNMDCDDAVFAINPGATEICNGVDDNCDTNIDEGVILTVPTSPATYTSYSVNHMDGASNNYVDACTLLGQISDAPGGNVLGNTTVSSVLSATVASPNVDGYIYGRRVYTVNASSTGAATLKLYFTQADFDNYNSNNSQFLDLPTSGNNADANKPNFRIVRVSGGTYAISGPLGDFLTWNSTDSRWEVDYAVADINADYYFVSMASCDGIVVSGLQATNVQGSSLVATWNDLVTTPTWGWYSLQYKPVASGIWINAGTSNGGTTSKFIAGLQPGTNYEIQIRRHCSSQSTGPWSSSVLFSTSNPACSSPPALSMTSINSNSATMTWPTITGAGWFEFRYSSVDPSGPWTTAGTAGGTSTSKMLSDLSSNTTYYVQARTFCASNGQPSEWGSTSFATPGASGCALPPALMAGTVNATNVTVNWPAVGGAGWFEFRYKLSSSGTWLNAGTLSGSAVSKLFGGLMAGTSYDIGARTFCSNGQPSEWGTIAVTTIGLAGCELPPSLSANPVNATNVTVNWQFISGAAWYEFRYKLSSSGTWLSAGTLGGNNISKIFSSLTPNTGYDIGARTFCSNGQPSAWTSISVTTGTTAGCELPPTLSMGSVSATMATLTWPSIGNVGWYEFRYSTSPTGPWTSGGTSGGASTSKVLQYLSPATTYYAQGRSFCASNGLPSAWGASVEFMTTGAGLIVQLPGETTVGLEDSGDENENQPAVSVILEDNSTISSPTDAEIFFQLNTMSIYPNPTKDIVNVAFYSMEAQKATVMVLDMTGRVLQQLEIFATTGLNTQVVNLEALPGGMYIIQLRENGRLTQVGKAQKLD